MIHVYFLCIREVATALGSVAYALFLLSLSVIQIGKLMAIVFQHIVKRFIFNSLREAKQLMFEITKISLFKCYIVHSRIS